MMTDLTTLKNRLLADAATKAEYEAQASEFAVARELIVAHVVSLRKSDGEPSPSLLRARDRNGWPVLRWLATLV